MAISKETLDFLNEKKITQPHTLGHLIDDRSSEGVAVIKTNQYTNQNVTPTSEYVLKYQAKGKTVPLEVRINPHMNYSTLRVNCQSPIIGYMYISKDGFGNRFQEKFMGNPKILVVKLMLEQLTKPETYHIPNLRGI